MQSSPADGLVWASVLPDMRMRDGEETSGGEDDEAGDDDDDDVSSTDYDSDMEDDLDLPKAPTIELLRFRIEKTLNAAKDPRWKELEARVLQAIPGQKKFLPPLLPLLPRPFPLYCWETRNFPFWSVLMAFMFSPLIFSSLCELHHPWQNTRGRSAENFGVSPFTFTHHSPLFFSEGSPVLSCLFFFIVFKIVFPSSCRSEFTEDHGNH